MILKVMTSSFNGILEMELRNQTIQILYTDIKIQVNGTYMHSLTIGGAYNITLHVTDSQLQTSVARVMIVANNEAPAVKITTPPDNSVYPNTVGTLTTFTSTVTDDTPDSPVYQWEARLIHNKYYPLNVESNLPVATSILM